MAQNCNEGSDVNSHYAHTHTHTQVCLCVCACVMCVPALPAEGATPVQGTQLAFRPRFPDTVHHWKGLVPSGLCPEREQRKDKMSLDRPCWTAGLCSEHEGTYPRTQASWGDIPPDPGLLRGRTSGTRASWGDITPDPGLLRGCTSGTRASWGDVPLGPGPPEGT